MSDTSDDSDERTGEPSEETTAGDAPEQGRGARGKLEQEADRAKSGFDQGIVDILSWLLDTETRARIYVYLRQHPWSTSEEVAEGTGLYPSTVREALAELAEEETVERRKRESEGAGNNPYEYTAIPPSDLVGGVVGRVQDELNTVFNLDAKLGRGGESGESEPVRIEVESGSSAAAEVGESEAEAETDVSAAAEVDDEGAEVEGEVGAGVGVEGDEESAGIEGNVGASAGVDEEEGADASVDTEVDVETPDEEGGDGETSEAGSEEERGDGETSETGSDEEGDDERSDERGDEK